MKDETLSHVPLFMQIFRTAIKESFNGEIPFKVKNRCLEMIKLMAEAEIRWTTYASRGLPSFSDKTIEVFIQSKANSVCKNLGLPLLYEVNASNPLQKLLIRYLYGSELDTRQNFFEKNSLNYNHGGLNWDMDN